MCGEIVKSLNYLKFEYRLLNLQILTKTSSEKQYILSICGCSISVKSFLRI